MPRKPQVRVEQTIGIDCGSCGHRNVAAYQHQTRSGGRGRLVPVSRYTRNMSWNTDHTDHDRRVHPTAESIGGTVEFRCPGSRCNMHRPVRSDRLGDTLREAADEGRDILILGIDL